MPDCNEMIQIKSISVRIALEQLKRRNDILIGSRISPALFVDASIFNTPHGDILRNERRGHIAHLAHSTKLGKPATPMNQNNHGKRAIAWWHKYLDVLRGRVAVCNVPNRRRTIEDHVVIQGEGALGAHHEFRHEDPQT